jgi:adenine-specific DNA-methyltransferase
MEDIDNIPNIIKHLAKFKPILEARRENIKGIIKFFQLQWPREESIFKNKKIMIPYRFPQIISACPYNLGFGHTLQ